MHQISHSGGPSDEGLCPSTGQEPGFADTYAARLQELKAQSPIDVARDLAEAHEALHRFDMGQARRRGRGGVQRNADGTVKLRAFLKPGEFKRPPR